MISASSASLNTVLPRISNFLTTIVSELLLLGISGVCGVIGASKRSGEGNFVGSGGLMGIVLGVESGAIGRLGVRFV